MWDFCRSPKRSHNVQENRQRDSLKEQDSVPDVSGQFINVGRIKQKMYAKTRGSRSGVKWETHLDLWPLCLHAAFILFCTCADVLVLTGCEDCAEDSSAVCGFSFLFVPLSEGECWNRAVGSLRFLCVCGSDDFFKQIWSRCELCNISSQKRNWIVKFVANANVCKENCRSGILKTFSFGLFVFNFVHLRCVTLLMRRLR